MYTIVMLTHAAEMTLLTDNSGCKVTFPYCMRWPSVNMAKSKSRLKIVIKSNLFLCQQSLKFFTAIFFKQFFVFLIAKAHIDVIFPQKLAFSMMS